MKERAFGLGEQQLLQEDCGATQGLLCLIDVGQHKLTQVTANYLFPTSALF